VGVVVFDGTGYKKLQTTLWIMLPFCQNIELEGGSIHDRSLQDASADKSLESLMVSLLYLFSQEFII
jgi:hypothetical protein